MLVAEVRYVRVCLGGAGVGGVGVRVYVGGGVGSCCRLSHYKYLVGIGVCACMNPPTWYACILPSVIT